MNILTMIDTIRFHLPYPSVRDGDRAAAGEGRCE